jgi:hypothetical protein
MDFDTRNPAAGVDCPCDVAEQSDAEMEGEVILAASSTFNVRRQRRRRRDGRRSN